MPLTYLHHASSHRWCRWQAIADPIVGQVAIPADFALFGGKAFPGKGRRQRREPLLLMAISGTFVGGTMHSDIDALAPGVCLAIEVVHIREGDSCPEALLNDPDRALDFAFRLW